MNITSRCRRKPGPLVVATLGQHFEQVDRCWAAGNHIGALDIVAALVEQYPSRSIEFLARVHPIFMELENRTRYELYQQRLFDFPIRPGERVLDIGSGHMPFPLATHLADIATTDDGYGRAGVPFRWIEDKPVFEVPLENTGFADKEFDFVYCSHVLEHATDPEKACAELIRIAKRGYIETPSPAKDFFLQMAGVSNHRWSVDLEGDFLSIVEYTPRDIVGIGSDVLLHMCCDPVTEREKALKSLLLLCADRVNTMFMWEDSFEYSVRRIAMPPQAS
ncbi:methyltransferase family protein [Azospirillum baldaniorum]|uniref:class I SAM-dependent methyltransferase n=1 Tax=Azospirillum baldaniorum TaxID=1064539 RepID=UPI0011A34F16|nr:methyltransferase domain-containing protein [Azospirillum baldaniorum]TWA53121.1 methyltransferase family protein [Azospirillum baldaniorum]